MDVGQGTVMHDNEVHTQILNNITYYYSLCNPREVDGKVGVEFEGAAFGGSFLDAKHQVPTPGLAQFYWLHTGRSGLPYRMYKFVFAPQFNTGRCEFKDEQKCCLSASKFNERI